MLQNSFYREGSRCPANSTSCYVPRIRSGNSTHDAAGRMSRSEIFGRGAPNAASAMIAEYARATGEVARDLFTSVTGHRLPRPADRVRQDILCVDRFGQLPPFLSLSGSNSICAWPALPQCHRPARDCYSQSHPPISLRCFPGSRNAGSCPHKCDAPGKLCQKPRVPEAPGRETEKLNARYLFSSYPR